jgi:hypothetical protein
MDMQLVLDRLIRLVRLDTTVFEEARDDVTGTIPAAAIALISFLIAGFGGWLWWVVQGYGDKTKVFWQSFLLGSIFGFGMWVAWIAIAFVILVNVFRYSVNFERMLRSCGYAAVPVVVSFFMFIPGINIGIGLAGFALLFLTMDVGIQVAVDAQPGHVILATFAGFVVFCAVLSLLVGSDNVLAPNVFLFRSPATGLADLASAFNGSRIPRIP